MTSSLLTRCLGASLAYDGIYWDLLHGYISWLSDDIDSDLDGHPDASDAVNAAYRAAVEDLIVQVRTRLPHVVITGNEAPHDYAAWINGRCFEWQCVTPMAWNTLCGRSRRRIIVVGRSVGRHRGQPSFSARLLTDLPGQARRQLGTSHIGAFPGGGSRELSRHALRLDHRLLMGDGLFFYDLRGPESRATWYDEFGAPPNARFSTLPAKATLGSPKATRIFWSRSWIRRTRFSTVTSRMAFATGVSGLVLLVARRLTSILTEGSRIRQPCGSASAGQQEHRGRCSSQYDQSTAAGQDYTVSFWGRSSVTRTIEVEIDKQDPPGTHYGFRVQANVTPGWQHFHLTDAASVTAGDGQLKFEIGEESGELWLDDVQLQTGALGVRAREFEHGLAVINTTKQVQTAPLPGVYYKLRGGQAPLFQAACRRRRGRGFGRLENARGQPAAIRADSTGCHDRQWGDGDVCAGPGL